jgi:hypothetical protein
MERRRSALTLALFPATFQVCFLDQFSFACTGELFRWWNRLVTCSTETIHRMKSGLELPKLVKTKKP